MRSWVRWSRSPAWCWPDSGCGAAGLNRAGDLGARGLREDDLHRDYRSYVDPRLNYEQAMELAFFAARKMRTLNGYASAAGGVLAPKADSGREAASTT